ncbi:unnamed protein product, partial [Mesorhabditis belari]|uniref:Uncharacterized protein n=1 Tax=Mesorhabditis belari TaxID=2138241 RepID=A0AAF3FND5_9BILA
MAESLLENYNPLYDVHLRQYFALPHMQKHLRRMGLIDSNGKMRDGQDAVYARHNMMMDMMLKNREQQLLKLAELQKKLDAAEKVEIYRRIRSGQSPESFRRTKASRSLSRGRPRENSGSRQRRFSNSLDDKELIQKIETKDEPEKINEKDPYARLSAKASKYRYLHKLDDKTLVDYQEQLKRELDRLERFREVSFGVHSVARHPPSSAQSWFFRRRSLPSLTQSLPTAALHEPLRSVNSLRGRKANASPRRQANDSCPPTVRQRRTSNSANPRLPPIQRKHVSKSAAAAPTAKTSAKPLKLPPAQPRSAPKPSTKARSSSNTKTIKREKLPALEAIGVGIGVASAAALTRKSEPKPKLESLSGAPLASPVTAESEHSEEPTTEDEHCAFYDNGYTVRPESNATNGTSETGGADETDDRRSTGKEHQKRWKLKKMLRHRDLLRLWKEFMNPEGTDKSPTPVASPVASPVHHIEEHHYDEREAEGEPHDEEHHSVHKRVLNEEDYPQENQEQEHVPEEFEAHHELARSPEHRESPIERHSPGSPVQDQEVPRSPVEHQDHMHRSRESSVQHHDAFEAHQASRSPVEHESPVQHHHEVPRSPVESERRSPIEHHSAESPVQDQAFEAHHEVPRSPVESERRSPIEHHSAESPVQERESPQAFEAHHEVPRSPVESERRSPVEQQDHVSRSRESLVQHHHEVPRSPVESERRSPVEHEQHHEAFESHHEVLRSPDEIEERPAEHEAFELQQPRSPVESEHHDVPQSPIEHESHEHFHESPARSPSAHEAFETHHEIARSPEHYERESPEQSGHHSPAEEHFDQHHSPTRSPVGHGLEEAFEAHHEVPRSPEHQRESPIEHDHHEHYEEHKSREQEEEEFQVQHYSPVARSPEHHHEEEHHHDMINSVHEHHVDHDDIPVHGMEEREPEHPIPDVIDDHHEHERRESPVHHEYNEERESPVHDHHEEHESPVARSPIEHHYEERPASSENAQFYQDEPAGSPVHEEEPIHQEHHDEEPIHQEHHDEEPIHHHEDEHVNLHHQEDPINESIVESHSYSPVEQPHLEVEPEVAFNEESQEHGTHQLQEDIGDHMKPASPLTPNSPDRRSSGFEQHHDHQPMIDDVRKSPMEIDYERHEEDNHDHHHLNDQHEIREEHISPMSQGNDEESYHSHHNVGHGIGLGVPEILETAASERGVGSEDNLSTDSMIIHQENEEKEEEGPIGDQDHLETHAEEIEGSSDENGNNENETHKQYPDGTQVFEHDYEDENGAQVHKKIVHSEHSDDNGHYYSHHESEVHTRLIHAGSKTPGSENAPAPDSPRMSPTVEQSTL